MLDFHQEASATPEYEPQRSHSRVQHAEGSHNGGACPVEKMIRSSDEAKVKGCAPCGEM